MHRIVVTAFALTVLVASGDAFSQSVSGFYQLVSVNGNPLPYSQTFTHDSVSVETTLNASSYTLNEDGTFSMSNEMEVVSDVFTGERTLTASGTFTLVEPDTVQFTTEHDDQFSGTLDGDRLTVIEIEEGTIFVYERELRRRIEENQRRR